MGGKLPPHWQMDKHVRAHPTPRSHILPRVCYYTRLFLCNSAPRLGLPHLFFLLKSENWLPFSPVVPTLSHTHITFGEFRIWLYTVRGNLTEAEFFALTLKGGDLDCMKVYDLQMINYIDRLQLSFYLKHFSTSQSNHDLDFTKSHCFS